MRGQGIPDEQDLLAFHFLFEVFEQLYESIRIHSTRLKRKVVLQVHGRMGNYRSTCIGMGKRPFLRM